MSESNYWNRLHSTRLSRRSALRGGGLGLAGLTGALLIGCGGDDDDGPAAPAPTGRGNDRRRWHRRCNSHCNCRC